jgi:hypothetical protein
VVYNTILTNNCCFSIIGILLNHWNFGTESNWLIHNYGLCHIYIKLILIRICVCDLAFTCQIKWWIMTSKTLFFFFILFQHCLLFKFFYFTTHIQIKSRKQKEIQINKYKLIWQMHTQNITIIILEQNKIRKKNKKKSLPSHSQLILFIYRTKCLMLIKKCSEAQYGLCIELLQI